MKLPGPLIPGRFVRRYKRFLAEVQLESGEMVTAHCPNPGSMLGLLHSNSLVYLSYHDNPRRKLQYTWELVKPGSAWVLVNTLIANQLAAEALNLRRIPALTGYESIRREVWWEAHSRLDFMLCRGEERCYVEVKSVTLAEKHIARFPDAKTARGRKHLQALTEAVKHGHRGVMLFLVNRADCHSFAPAAAIDPLYAEALRQAHQQGVEILVYRWQIRLPYVAIDRPLPYDLLL